MAEILFKNILKKQFPGENEFNWVVGSAGTWTVDGEPASLGAQAAMARRELTLINHRSHQITSDLLGKFNLILVMESGQKEALQVEFAHNAKKIFLLSEMVGDQYDIKDPIGGSIGDYENTAREIETILQKGFERILQLSK